MSDKNQGYVEIDESAASTILYLARSVWRYRIAIGAFTGLLVILSLVYGFSAQPVYRATVTAMPTGPQSPLAGKLGGFAALSGALNGAGAAGDIGPSPDETVAVLSSRRLAFEFFKKEDALPILFSDGWDPAQRNWKPPGALARTLAWIKGTPVGTGEPSYSQAYLTFSEMLHVQFDMQNGLITVSVDAHSPDLAARWANDFVKDANDLMRDRSQHEATEGLAFLEEQASQASLTDLREAIYSAAAREITKAMYARTKQEYALKVLDPAMPPLSRYWPQRSFLVLIAAIAGVFLGSIAAMMWGYISEVRRLDQETFSLDAKAVRKTVPKRSSPIAARSNAEAKVTI